MLRMPVLKVHPDDSILFNNWLRNRQLINKKCLSVVDSLSTQCYCQICPSLAASLSTLNNEASSAELLGTYFQWEWATYWFWMYSPPLCTMTLNKYAANRFQCSPFSYKPYSSLLTEISFRQLAGSYVSCQAGGLEWPSIFYRTPGNQLLAMAHQLSHSVSDEIKIRVSEVYQWKC